MLPQKNKVKKGLFFNNKITIKKSHLFKKNMLFCYIRKQLLVARSLRERGEVKGRVTMKFFFEAQEKSQALVAGPLRKELFFRLP